MEVSGGQRGSGPNRKRRFMKDAFSQAPLRSASFRLHSLCPPLHKPTANPGTLRIRLWSNFLPAQKRREDQGLRPAILTFGYKPGQHPMASTKARLKALRLE